MKIICMIIVYSPTVSLEFHRFTTYGGHDTGEVPRSDFMERATPMPTSTSPRVATPYLTSMLDITDPDLLSAIAVFFE